VTDIVHSRCPQLQKECAVFITVMNLAINYLTSSFISLYFPCIAFSLTEHTDFTFLEDKVLSLSLNLSLSTLSDSNVKDGVGESYTC